MDEDHSLITVLLETEYLMCDILLSGFHSLQHSTLERLEELGAVFEQLGMEEGKKILNLLNTELTKYKNSFQSDTKLITRLFCRLEFYLKTARQRLE